MGRAKHSGEKGGWRFSHPPFSLLCFGLPILPFPHLTSSPHALNRIISFSYWSLRDAVDTKGCDFWSVMGFYPTRLDHQQFLNVLTIIKDAMGFWWINFPRCDWKSPDAIGKLWINFKRCESIIMYQRVNTLFIYGIQISMCSLFIWHSCPPFHLIL